MQLPTQLLASVILLLTFPSPITAILRLKLQHWLPTDEDVWESAATKCQPQITAYLLNNRTKECPPLLLRRRLHLERHPRHSGIKLRIGAGGAGSCACGAHAHRPQHSGGGGSVD